MRTISAHKGTREGLCAERWNVQAVNQPSLAGILGGNHVGTPKSRASMMPSSNRTPAMKVGNRWRSIPNCHWPTRNTSMIRPWGASLFSKRAGVLCIPALVYLISYFAAGDSLRSDTPKTSACYLAKPPRIRSSDRMPGQIASDLFTT